MPSGFATAIAHPNIALIKYWGDRDPLLHIPANGSISMSLDGLLTRTKVAFKHGLTQDQFSLNGKEIKSDSLARVTRHLDRVRAKAGISLFASVESENNFPTGTGIASSASGFAALTLAAASALGLNLNEQELSRLARTGSGSACRSIPAGFVEWQAGTGDEDSFAQSIKPPGYWDIVDCIALVNGNEKTIGSGSGHLLASTSLLQSARVVDAPRRLDICLDALLKRDFDRLADIVELDSNLMHAVMITSTPPLFYWLPATLAILQAVQGWRKSGVPACYTIDAGPNVHVLCPGEAADNVINRLQELAGVKQVLKASPGGPAWLETA